MKLPVSINLQGKLSEKKKQIKIMVNNIVIGTIWPHEMATSTTMITIDV